MESHIVQPMACTGWSSSPLPGTAVAIVGKVTLVIYTRGPLLRAMPPRGHWAMSGCHKWFQGKALRYWYLLGRAQGCCRTSFNTQDHPINRNKDLSGVRSQSCPRVKSSDLYVTSSQLGYVIRALSYNTYRIHKVV